MNINTQQQLEAKFFKGLADKSRLAILEALLTGPKTVSEIVTATELSQPNTSAHLTCLLECGIVRREKQGREVMYQISMEEVATIIQAARGVLKQHSEEIYNCTRY